MGSTLMLLAIAACSSQQPESQNGNRADSAIAENLPAMSDSTDERQGGTPNVAEQQPAGAPGTPGGLPDDRSQISEPSGPIHPASAEAAGQTVQRYGGLLEQRKFAEARKLWGDGGRASGLSESQFAAAYDKYANIHSEVGKPTDMEGAAGSVYITVPFRLHGTLKSGGTFNVVGPLTLRRVNDVPGSTAAQRRWHIEKSSLKPGAEARTSL